MSEQFSFRVVRILDEFSVVIDAGYDNGVKKDDLFQIYVPGETITDPNNPEEVLGTLDTIKATIKAVQVSPAITVCNNAEGPALMPELEKAFSAFRFPTRPLRIDPTQVQTTSFSKEPIKLGDKVRKLPND
jgi:hypothetical protein